MKSRIWCAKHKRRHSSHAAMHCRTGVKVGQCFTTKMVAGSAFMARGERCPLVQSHLQRERLAA